MRTLNALQTHANEQFCGLVFNLDEMGVSEWEERKSREVVIPMDMKGLLIRHKVLRTISHLIVLTCVAESGNALCPVIVTWGKVLYDIYEGGHCPGNDFLIGRNAKPYVDRAIFEPFIRHHGIEDYSTSQLLHFPGIQQTFSRPSPSLFWCV
jgi:hypothetical protein